MARLASAQLRVARPTAELAPLVRFYSEGLGFDLLGSFEDHDGFSGVMLGHPELGYHLEFTTEEGVTPERAPTREHLLVFYLPERDDWLAACARLEALGYAPVEPHNPYWARAGRSFEDPDGYGVVLQNAAYPPASRSRATSPD